MFRRCTSRTGFLACPRRNDRGNHHWIWDQIIGDLQAEGKEYDCDLTSERLQWTKKRCQQINASQPKVATQACRWIKQTSSTHKPSASPGNKQIQETQALTVIEVSFPQDILVTYFSETSEHNKVRRIRKDIQVVRVYHQERRNNPKQLRNFPDDKHYRNETEGKEEWTVLKR